MILARACLAALFLTACKVPVDCSGTPPVAASGSWSYFATQTSPAAATLSGTLRISSQCGDGLAGSLDVMETDALGSRRRTGTVNGRAVDSTTLDFDVFLTTVGRRHVGTIARDSIKGTWLELDAGGSASGSFVAVRVP